MAIGGLGSNESFNDIKNYAGLYIFLLTHIVKEKDCSKVCKSVVKVYSPIDFKHLIEMLNNDLETQKNVIDRFNEKEDIREQFISLLDYKMTKKEKKFYDNIEYSEYYVEVFRVNEGHI